MTSTDLAVIDYLLQAPGCANQDHRLFRMDGGLESRWSPVGKSPSIAHWQAVLPPTARPGPLPPVTRRRSNACGRLLIRPGPRRSVSPKRTAPHPARIQCRLKADPETESCWRLHGTQSICLRGRRGGNPLRGGIRRYDTPRPQHPAHGFGSCGQCRGNRYPWPVSGNGAGNAPWTGSVRGGIAGARRPVAR